jgi:hypothetical protein
MSGGAAILPGTGRGTMRSMVEGHVPRGVTSRRNDVGLVPLHHLRWSPSPCRGGIDA